MHLYLIAIGTSMPSWIQTGFQEYCKRLPADFRLQLLEIPLHKRSKTTNIDNAVHEEGERMLAAIPKNSRAIALEINGNSWSTPQLAEQLKHWQLDNRPVTFLIGGPEGLSPACVKRTEQQWSLSPLTFPHPLVRILVAEQLYRAWSLLQGHPYHRG